MNTPYGAESKMPAIQPGWIGGDPNTGQNGDTGSFGVPTNTETLAQADNTFTSSNAEPSWYSTVKTLVAEKNFSAAVQVADNNIAWADSNLADPGSGLSYSANLTASLQSFGEVLACGATVGAVAVGTATMLADPLTATVPGFATTILSWAGAAGTCIAALASSWSTNNAVTSAPQPVGSPAYCGTFSVLNGADGSMLASGKVCGDFSPPGSDVIGAAKGATSASAIMPPPGFTPPQAFLDAVKPDMTAAALATCFPHG